MKLYKYVCLFMLTAGGFSACETDPKALQLQKPYTYDDAYYQNLREYKESDHSIAWGWFADYTQTHSLAIRFLGLPDSLDICSLWGGIPSDVEGREQTFYAPKIAEEMRFVQKVKGTKMVVPTIIRIENSQAYREQEFYKKFQESYTMNGTAEEKQALREEALRLYADFLLKPIWENDLDGIDLDFEPEGDRLDGDNMTYFVKYIGARIGPSAETPEGRAKLLCIDYDGKSVPSYETVPFVNYYVFQNYGSDPEGSHGFPIEKFVYCENIGDKWKTGGRLKDYAAATPAEGRKGGFGAFYIHRDYNSTPPYKNFREAIQIQNPAVY